MPGPASIWMPENIAKFEPNNDAKTENVYCQLRKVLPVRLKRQKNRMLHTANSASQEVVNEGASTTCEKKNAWEFVIQQANVLVCVKLIFGSSHSLDLLQGHFCGWAWDTRDFWTLHTSNILFQDTQAIRRPTNILRSPKNVNYCSLIYIITLIWKCPSTRWWWW